MYWAPKFKFYIFCIFRFVVWEVWFGRETWKCTGRQHKFWWWQNGCPIYAIKTSCKWLFCEIQLENWKLIWKIKKYHINKNIKLNWITELTKEKLCVIIFKIENMATILPKNIFVTLCYHCWVCTRWCSSAFLLSLCRFLMYGYM